MKCNLCDAEEPDDDTGIPKMLDHLRVMHPEQYGDGPERWPDGSIVVYDTTLEPGDFTEGKRS